MSKVTFNEHLRDLKGKSSRHIQLKSGPAPEGVIVDINSDMLVIQGRDQGAGKPEYWVPIGSIVYASDSEITPV